MACSSTLVKRSYEQACDLEPSLSALITAERKSNHFVSLAKKIAEMMLKKKSVDFEAALVSEDLTARIVASILVCCKLQAGESPQTLLEETGLLTLIYDSFNRKLPESHLKAAVEYACEAYTKRTGGLQKRDRDEIFGELVPKIFSGNVYKRHILTTIEYVYRELQTENLSKEPPL